MTYWKLKIMKKNKTQYFLFYTILFIGLTISNKFLSAQEVITGIGQNPIIQKAEKDMPKYKKLVSYEAVKLPFVDDFSNYTVFPKSELWIDKQVYINRNFAINPPTLGVATLDCIDEHGLVYTHASKEAFGADTLTSRPIRLDSLFNPYRPIIPADSVYLSFYYQPGGGTLPEWERIGNAPESGDSLILDFGYPTGDTVLSGFEYTSYMLPDNYSAGDSLENPYITGTFYIFEKDALIGEEIILPTDSILEPKKKWTRIWAADGCKLDDFITENGSYFKQVLIPIKDSVYFSHGFQFRFRNIASLEDNNITGWASNTDEWNIDYIRLNINRNYKDTTISDVCFVDPAQSVLKNYHAMPWFQFKGFQAKEMKDTFYNKLSNLSNEIKNTNYTYSVFKNDGTSLYDYLTNNENIKPYSNSGYQNYAPHTAPAVNFTIPNDNQDSALFIIRHIFQIVGSSDVCRQNDTNIYTQCFYNYYAYDDGSAESGYSLYASPTSPTAYLAMKIPLNKPDTLRAVRFFFNHVLKEANQSPFDIMVWSDNNNKPDQILLTMEDQYPQTPDSINQFTTYYLDNPLAVTGTFYVGFRQTHTTHLNLGFDRNTDSRNFFMYNTASSWEQSVHKGTPMIRPVVGHYFNPIGIDEEINSIASIKLYPNPAHDHVNIVCNGDNNSLQRIEIYNLTGQLIQTDKTNGENFQNINTSNFKSGIYIFKIYTANNVYTQKLTVF